MKNEDGGPRGTRVEGRAAYSVWWGDMMEIDHLKCLGVDESIILKSLCKNLGGKARIGMIWLSTGTGGGHL